MTTIGIDSSLFASLDPPVLVGSRCASCGTVAFPAQTGCANCAGDDLTPIPLPDHGSLWTWTVQDYEPKPPYRSPESGFEPFGVGYVDLGEVIVESRLLGDAADFTIDLPMQLTLLPLWADEAGASVVTYAFAPVGADT